MPLPELNFTPPFNIIRCSHAILDVTDLERSRFFQWLRVKREHQQAFVETLRLWEDLSVIRGMDYDELRSVPVVWEFKERVERARA